MNNRPKREETEEDILRMQEEFFAEKAKNPNMKSAAQVVKAPKKSLFKQNREKAQIQKPTTLHDDKLVLDEVTEKLVSNLKVTDDSAAIASETEIVLGDVVEKHYDAPKRHWGPTDNASSFPKVPKLDLTASVSPRQGKSLFALSMEAKPQMSELKSETVVEVLKNTTAETLKMSNVYGTTSVVVQDDKTAADVHKQNVELLSKMAEEEILAERKKLLESIDPALVALLAKKRQENWLKFTNKDVPIENQNRQTPSKIPIIETVTEELEATNAAIPILERSDKENWINFDVVEKDKLAWMQDIPMNNKKLLAGENFEARFDWKGVLLPYNTDAEAIKHDNKDDRDLYLHGDEPQRPGYTLQELFRLARSNVMQQRITAFGAIAGLLNIYNQGFYDQVLDLPITKIFFLLRFGMDDNTPAMLEVVTKAMAYLFYNETDEALLDFIYENPGCQWQPTLQVISTTNDETDNDPMSIENLQKQMKQLQMTSSTASNTKAFRANIHESVEESKTSMTDFQLAETDLIECLLRTNILQRIYFILHDVRPDNSTVSSCIKLLIRLARSGKDVAMQIVGVDHLLKCLFDNFLPGLEVVDTTAQSPPFYKYPQYLCLKLIRILCSERFSIAVKFLKMNLIEKLQNYLYTRDNIGNNLIKVQIEALRLLRCFLILRVDSALYKKFLPAFRYMLEWHYNHVVYKVGGPFLVRQHAAALLSTIASIPNDGVCLEVSSVLGDILHDCFCNWFYKATTHDIDEFSQITLLSTCVSVVTWLTRHSEIERLSLFHKRYLPDFIASKGFEKLIGNLSKSTIIIRNSIDRRNVHPALPNCGAIILHDCGPQLIISQSYPIFFVTSLWRLMELQLTQQKPEQQKNLFNAMLQPNIVEHLVKFVCHLQNDYNVELATNFFAKTELQLIYKLLCFKGLGAYFTETQMLKLVYNFLCCLTAEHIDEIEELFKSYIFNKSYMTDVDEKTLSKWCSHCISILVHPHAIIVSPTELSLSLPSTRIPVLPRDWPYYNVGEIIQHFIGGTNLERQLGISERDVLNMTFQFVAKLEENGKLEIATPTEQLMYLMIAFMGQSSTFLEADIYELLKASYRRFQAKHEHCIFQFDAVYEGKCKFEILYTLFVDHFQAASYANELFGALVLVPLAQKYDNKWRRRVWSEYASALRFINCDESLLFGGLDAYLTPAEEEESLLKAYVGTIKTNLLLPGSVPYRIAKHHIDEHQKRMKERVLRSGKEKI